MALDSTSYGSGHGGDAVSAPGGSGNAAAATAVTLGILASLGSAIALSVSRGRQKKQGISILGVDETGQTVIPQQTFQWWPEVITDSISIGWSEKGIPGASHGLMQWGQNGGRSFSMTIKLTRTLRPDIDFDGKAVPFTARGISPSGIRDLAHNVDIVRMVKYLRAYCYPQYDELNANLARPPVTAILHVPGLKLNEDGSDQISAVMTVCDVSYQRLFADGTPRYAEVTLGFKQIVQDNTGVHWKGRDVLLKQVDKGTPGIGLAGGTTIAVVSEPGTINTSII